MPSWQAQHVLLWVKGCPCVYGCGCIKHRVQYRPGCSCLWGCAGGIWSSCTTAACVGCEPVTCGCLLCTVCNRHTIALSARLCACQHPMRGWGRQGSPSNRCCDACMLGSHSNVVRLVQQRHCVLLACSQSVCDWLGWGRGLVRLAAHVGISLAGRSPLGAIFFWGVLGGWAHVCMIATACCVVYLSAAVVYVLVSLWEWSCSL